MAAVTPNSDPVRNNVGSLDLVTTDFASVNDGDTWSTDFDSIFKAWVNQTDDTTTQASMGAGVLISGTTIHFRVGEDGANLDFFALVKGA